MISADITAFVRRSATIVVLALSSACISLDVYADEPAGFVGGQVCVGCHVAETEAWKGSHHALAMQKTTEATVLGGPVDGACLQHARLGRHAAARKPGNLDRGLRRPSMGFAPKN